MFFRLCTRAPRMRIAGTSGGSSVGIGALGGKPSMISTARRARTVWPTCEMRATPGHPRRGFPSARALQHAQDLLAVGLQLPGADAADAGQRVERGRALPAPSAPAWRRGRPRRPAGCARAPPRRARPSARQSAPAPRVQRQRRRRVLRRARACGACRVAALRRALGTRSSSGTSPRSTSRALGASASVLYSPSTCTWPSAINWRSTERHCCSLSRRRCRRWTAPRGDAASLSVALPRSTSIRCTAPKRWPRAGEAVDAAQRLARGLGGVPGGGGPGSCRSCRRARLLASPK